MIITSFPDGCGPDNSLTLNLNGAFAFDVPSQYFLKLNISHANQWESASCIYSMVSGAKVWETGNYERGNIKLNQWELRNNSSSTQSFLVTAWYKEGSQDPKKIWKQSLNYFTMYHYKTSPENRIFETLITFRQNDNTTDSSKVSIHCRVELYNLAK